MRNAPDSNQVLIGTAAMTDRCPPSLSGHVLPPYKEQYCKLVFPGLEQGAAAYYESPTPGGCGRRSIIYANQPLAARIDAIGRNLDPTNSYEDNPEAYERRVCRQFADVAPELMAAMAYAKARDAVIVELHGLPLSGPIPATPVDGVVHERSVRTQVRNLVGAVAGGWGLSGFAYSSENNSKLLRAVCPQQQYASTASSQGYEEDLVWHQDNANRAIPCMLEHYPATRGPMNPFQAFVAVRPIVPPMEVIALADVIHQAVGLYGPGLVEQLTRNDFAVNQPASHGGGRDAERVPLLVRDKHGAWHGRFHAINVIGLTGMAQHALQLFAGVVVKSRCVIEPAAQPGTVLFYSNTRCMHGRRKYAARLDGNDRYYVRLYLMPSDMLSQHASAIVKGRIFS